MNSFGIIKIFRKTGKFFGYRFDFTPITLEDSPKAKSEYFLKLGERASKLPGAFVECGLGNGFSFSILAEVASKKNKEIFGFDSFKGFPSPKGEDFSRYKIKEGDWSNVEIANVKNAVLKRTNEEFLQHNTRIIPGFLCDTLPHIDLEKIALLHLDVDLYQSYLDALEVLYNKVVIGGIIIIDEYLNGIEYAKYPGGYLAVKNFFTDKNVDICRDLITGKYYIVKLS